MQIAQIDLENVKSYRRESVVFSEGTNAICGPNGAGKSTLLEAIGFALFDFLPFTRGNFVREGEKTATVTVHLVGDDDRAYQIVRSCGSNNQYYVYDPEIKQRLTNGREETVKWLYEYLGAEETSDLSALFQDAVGVPQGLLTAAFLNTPANRKTTFNPLLRVDEYEKVWRALLDPCHHLEKLITDSEKLIAGYEAEVKALPGWREKATGLEADIEKDEESVMTFRTELEEVTQHKETLETIKQQLDDLNQSVTRADANVRTLATQLAEAQSAVTKAKEACSVVLETEAGHQAYLKTQSNLEALDKQRKERDSLNKALQGYITDLKVAQQRIEGLEARLDAIAAADAKMDELAPQVEAQEKLEAELSTASSDAGRLANAEQNLQREQTRLDEMKARLSTVQNGLKELDRIEQETKTLEVGLDDLGNQRDAFTAQIAALQAELDQLSEQTAALETIETAECPVCEGPLTSEHRTELLERNQARGTELGFSLTEARSHRDEAEKEGQERQKRLRALEKQVKKLPRPAEADDLTTQIDKQMELLAKIVATVQGLAGAPAEVERLTAELKAIGNPRREHQRAADVASQRQDVEDDLAATGERCNGLQGEIDAFDEKLADYVDLDERIGIERAALDTYEPDHQRFLQHIREAEELSNRQERAKTLDEELATSRAKHDDLVRERDQVAAEYDADAYAEAMQRYDALRALVATLDERISQRRGQLKEAQAEIFRLEGVQVELEKACTEHGELNDLLALLRHIRQVLRDAGPKITKVLVELISLQAAHLYADIMMDHSAQLSWTEDYEILLTTNGRKRIFRQLSGGEQMAAALAVRLALLREVSAVDIAFFDEPTANLDDDRRDNLAEQILNVKGFSQLFVISHDDTFERDTDNVVRVVKENGISRVEV
jgi:exonuclease SbcC